MSKRIVSHMWVKGSDNADCVKAWFNVNRLVNYDEQYKDITKQKFLTNSESTMFITSSLACSQLSNCSFTRPS